MKRPVAILVAIAALAGSFRPAHAQVQTANLLYECQIGGMPATLQAGVELMGRTKPPGGWRATYVWGVIMSPGARVYYGGQGITPTTRYVFTGELSHAEFTDLGTGDSFYVQFIPNRDQLTLIANPQGPMPVQIPCQLKAIS